MSPRWPADLFLLLLLTALAIWRAIHLNTAATAALYPEKTTQSPYQTSVTYREEEEHLVMGDKPDNLFYFVQISDLHISRYAPVGGATHFLHFLRTVLPQLSPSFVFLTGDLTDAMDDRHHVSQQQSSEWAAYRAALQETGVLDRPGLWHDLRGNHDCFDVPGWQSERNFYREYGVSAGEGGRVFGFQVERAFGRATAGFWMWIWCWSKDSCRVFWTSCQNSPKRGPARPFNFFGYLTSKDMDRFEEELVKPPGSNHTFVSITEQELPSSSSHTTQRQHSTLVALVKVTASETYHNTSVSTHAATSTSFYMACIYAPHNPDARTAPYHNPHANPHHLRTTTAGLGETLKAYHPRTGFLELELADMKFHATYRIMAVDYDLISFVDLPLPLPQLPWSDGPLNIFPPSPLTPLLPSRIPSPPVVLVTNPKDARFVIPSREPVRRIRRSTHIRLLVFTDTPEGGAKVTIWIDNVVHTGEVMYSGRGKAGQIGEGYVPLWTAAWDPSVYDDGREHRLVVEVVDGEGKIGRAEEVVFRVDGGRSAIGGGVGELLILSDMTVLPKLVSITLFIITFLLLLLPKLHVLYLTHTSRLHSHLIALTAHIHRLDLRHHARPFSLTTLLRLHTTLWRLRFFRLAHSSPRIWFVLYARAIWLLTLPWLGAHLVPSAGPEEGFGWIYWYGVRIARNWVPLADTWLNACFEIAAGLAMWVVWFAVGAAGGGGIVLASRCEAGAEADISGENRPRKLIGEWWVVRAAVVAVWGWRVHGCVEIMGLYGGVWSGVWFNSGAWWLGIVAVAVVCGRGGVAVWWRCEERMGGCLCEVCVKRERGEDG
ncbi:hypothetical protein BC936DRAFT_146906, partial [Jimgerdemannia flammicorona]